MASNAASAEAPDPPAGGPVLTLAVKQQIVDEVKAEIALENAEVIAPFKERPASKRAGWCCEWKSKLKPSLPA